MASVTLLEHFICIEGPSQRKVMDRVADYERDGWVSFIPPFSAELSNVETVKLKGGVRYACYLRHKDRIPTPDQVARGECILA